MPAPVGIRFPFGLLNKSASSRFDLSVINQTSRGWHANNWRISGPTAELWTFSLPLAGLNETEWRELDGFMSGVYVNRGLVRVFDPMRQVPRGRVCNPHVPVTFEPWGDETPWGDGSLWSSEYYNGMRVAQAAPMNRDTILMSGAIPSQALSVAAGDLFEINGFLYKAAYDARSDSAGRVRVSIRPRLREAIADGDRIKFFRPEVTMRVAQADWGGLNRNHNSTWADASLAFYEVTG